MAYDAFISYSHAADGLLAPRLQEGIQKFAKPWYRRRALNIFRDQTGLSANPGLWTSITTALDNSKYFVLLASPEAAESVWVNREVEYWLEHKDPNNILPVLTDGTWAWDEELGGFDPVLTTAVPAALAVAFSEEPRHLDMVWAREDEHLDLHNARFRDQVAELAAPMHGKAKDELEGDDVRQHRRTLRVAWGAGLALFILMLLSAGAAVAAVRNANTAAANEQAAIAAQQQATDNANEAGRQRSAADANAADAARRKDEADANAAEAARRKKEADDNAAQADANANDANTQRSSAELSAAEAQRQKQQAEANAEEARRQQGLADANAEEARNQQANAEASAAEAERRRIEAENANVALAQQTDIANANALEASLQRDAANASAAEALRQKALAEANANLSTAHSLAANATALADSQYDTSLLLAVEGHRLADDADTRSGLLSSLNAAPLEHEVHSEFDGQDLSRAAVAQNGSFVVSPDLATSTIHVTDLATRRQRPTVFWKSSVGNAYAPLSLSPGGALLASGNAQGDMLLWQVSDGTLLLDRHGHNAAVIGGAFTSDASGFVTIAADGTVVMWDVATGTPRWTTTVLGTGGQAAALEVVKVSPSGSSLVVGTSDGAVVNLDATSGSVTWTTAATSPFPVSALAFSPNGSALAAGDTVGYVSFLDASTGATTYSKLSLSVNEAIHALAFLSNGRTLLVGGQSGLVGRLSVPDHAWLAPLGSHRGTVLEIVPQASATDPSNPNFVTLGTSEAAIWSLNAPTPTYTAAALGNVGTALAATADGHTLAILDRANNLTLYDYLGLGSGSLMQASGAAGLGGPATSRPAFNEPGTEVAVGVDPGSGPEVHVYDAPSANLLSVWHPTGPGAELSTLAYAPRTGLLAIAGPSGVSLLDRFGNPLATYGVGQSGPVSLSWSPSGTQLAVGSGESVTVLDGTQLTPVGAAFPSFHSSIARDSVKFSPNGDRIAIAFEDGNVELIAADTHALVGEPITLDPSDLRSLVYSPDGTKIAVGASDGTVRVIDAITARQVGPPLKTTISPTGDVAFLDGGDTMVSSIELASAVVFRDLRPSSWEAAACAIAGRNLTPTEWAQYFPAGTPQHATCPEWP